MKNREAGVRFIMVTLLLDVLGIGLIIPVMPKLFISFGGGDISEGAGAFGWFGALYGLMQFLFAPMLGTLSDTYGRRPILLLSVLGAGLDYVFMAFAPTLEWLFVGRIISGMTAANITCVNAYIADVTPPEKRAASFGMVGAMFGIGFILGPAMGGLLGGLGLRAPFIAAAALNVCNALYGFFVLPESLPRERRKAFTPSGAVPGTALVALKRYPVVVGIMLVIVLFSFAQQGLQTTWVIYTTYRYNWSELDNGLALSAVGISAAVVQGGLTRIIVPKLGERRALIIGMLINVVAFIAYGAATQGWMLYVILIVAGIGGIAGPSAQSLISRGIPSNEQGTVQGAVASLISITGVISPIVFTQLFGHYTGKNATYELPGVGFFFGAGCIAVGIVLALWSFRKLPEVTAAISAETAAPPSH